MKDMKAILKPLRSIDWDNIDEVERATHVALAELLRDRSAIRSILLGLPDRPELMGLCEHYDILDKIVLYTDDCGIRVRLHVFLPGYFDRPHNHRWSYASQILRGGYRHFLYGNAELDETIDPSELKALHVRDEPSGTSYALHHSMVHAVVAEPFTVSLIIRGPAVKDRFLVMDRATGESWWQYGATQESAEDAARKQMSSTRLVDLTNQLREWDLF
jgi:hypothetical protein